MDSWMRAATIRRGLTCCFFFLLFSFHHRGFFLSIVLLAPDAVATAAAHGLGTLTGSSTTLGTGKSKSPAMFFLAGGGCWFWVTARLHSPVLLEDDNIPACWPHSCTELAPLPVSAFWLLSARPQCPARRQQAMSRREHFL